MYILQAFKDRMSVFVCTCSYVDILDCVNDGNWWISLCKHVYKVEVIFHNEVILYDKGALHAE